MTDDSATFAASVTAPRAKPMLALGAWYFALVGLAFIVGFREHPAVIMTLGVLSAVGTSAWMMRLGAGKTGTLVVTPKTITLGQGSLTRSALRISVVAWKQPHLWTVIGTALELEGTGGKLCVGGTGYSPPGRQLRSVTHVDASLSAEDFARLSRTLGVDSDLLTRATNERTEIELVPSRTGAAGALRPMAPWLVTIALAGSVGVLGSVVGLDESPVGRGIVTGVTIVIIVVGLISTFRKSARAPSVRYRLVVGSGSVQVLDARPGAVSPAVPTRFTPVTYRYSTKYGSYDFPALRLDFTDRASMVIGVWDQTKAWRSSCERTRRLDYLVGNGEWQILTRAIGVA
ncbi:MAG TPA: hypothetical protein VF395_05025 [Polyangiaceae bacterium]